MPTFLYEPGVRVYINSAKHGLLDVSEDLSSGTMVRRSDGVSTFDFQMNNPRRRYDGVFTPNDRIVCVMKRVTWLRTFTGLLNSVPLLSVWPRDVSLRASCSLKRLQYWYWDPYAPSTAQMIQQAFLASGTAKPGTANYSTDGGVTNVVLTILDQVVGWPKGNVHIGKIPSNWFKIAVKIAQQVESAAEEADVAAQQYEALLGGVGTVSGNPVGTPATLDGKLVAGTYGGTYLDDTQAGYATTIYAVALGMGLSSRDGMLGIMCAMQESSLRNLDHGDRDSLGLFQQRPSQGWGTAAQIMNPQYAATSFFNALAKVTNRNSMTETQAIQAVQRSGYPNAYQQWLPLGKAAAAALSKASGGSAGTGTGSTAPPSVTGGVQATGAAIAAKGQDLVNKYQIPYEQTPQRSNADMLRDPPGPMDCSMFVAAVHLRVLGKQMFPYPKVSIMRTWLEKNGKHLTLDAARHTAGAMLMNGNEHVAISMGDGTHLVGAYHPGTVAGVSALDDAGWAQWYTDGWEAPGISYDGHAAVPITGDPSSAPPDSNLQSTVPYSTVPGYDKNNPFDKLFGQTPWFTQPDVAAQAFAESLTGIRALLNDQPLLPYLKNLFYSTMRSFCSAPNGDLIAWFPDYYGLWGTAAKMVIQPIEMLDFTIDWSDDSLVTHMFTVVSQPGAAVMDVSTGTWSQTGTISVGNLPGDMRMLSRGIATIDIPSLLEALLGIPADAAESASFANFVYRRFGARPAFEEMPGLVGPTAEFFSAVFKFMFYWAFQYTADVPLTFMPELFPGMLIQIPAYGFQAYVTTVTHSFSLAQGGGFHTTVNICAPARIASEDPRGVLLGLPEAGDYAEPPTSITKPSKKKKS